MSTSTIASIATPILAEVVVVRAESAESAASVELVESAASAASVESAA
jgi:hypothetical protein